jgi:putative membrane protein
MEKTMWLLRLSGQAAVIYLVAAPVFADPQDGRYGHPMMWDGGGWFMLFGPIMMLLFLALVVGLVVLAVRWLMSSGHGLGSQPSSPGRAPLDILKERLARGEIEVAEYEERRRALGEG